MGKTQQPHGQASGDTEAKIDQGKQQQVAAHRVTCSLHGLRRNCYPPPRRKAYEAVAQICSAVEHKKQEYDDQQALAETRGDWGRLFQNITDGGCRRRWALRSGGTGLRFRRGLFKSLLDVRDPSLDALQPRGCALFQRRKLCAYIVGVAGDLDSYRSQLDR